MSHMQSIDTVIFYLILNKRWAQKYDRKIKQWTESIKLCCGILDSTKGITKERVKNNGNWHQEKD